MGKPRWNTKHIVTSWEHHTPLERHGHLIEHQTPQHYARPAVQTHTVEFLLLWHVSPHSRQIAGAHSVHPIQSIVMLYVVLVIMLVFNFHEVYLAATCPHAIFSGADILTLTNRSRSRSY